MIQINIFSKDDFTKVINFILKHNQPLKEVNKTEFFVKVEMSEELVEQLKREIFSEKQVEISKC